MTLPSAASILLRCWGGVRSGGNVAKLRATMSSDHSYQRIYRAVSRIPRGRVATYGQIAELAGIPRGARQVGYALAALPDDLQRVPWHRVINAKGEISARTGLRFGFEGLQQAMLIKEGIKFDEAGRVSLERYRWMGGEGTRKAVARRRKKKASAPRRHE